MNVNPMSWDAPYLLIVGALFVIVMCRANATYWVGRLAARGMERTRVATVMESPGYKRATATLNRWGAPVVSASFLTIGFQTLVNLSAGATRMPLPRYLPAVSIGCVTFPPVKSPSARDIPVLSIITTIMTRTIVTIITGSKIGAPK